MRKRLALLWTMAVLGAALALPATTVAASGYSYKTIYNYCNGNQVNIKIKNIAAGWTPADGLTVESKAQRQTSSGWQTVYTWARADYAFATNGVKHTLTVWRSYNGNSSYYFRIWLRLRAWDGNYILASKVLTSVKC
jgi:ABC-type transport system involved in multi-copper enzyme maturation permease subunit